MNGIDYRELKKALEQTDKIITPRLSAWLLTEADNALPEKIAQKMQDLLTTQPRYRGQSFSASSATFCLRSQLFSYLDAPATQHDGRLMNIFMDGKWRHLRWQAMCLMAGILIEIEFPLEWPRKRSKGSMDGVGIVPDDHPRLRWRGKEFGFELKGMNSMIYQKVVATDTLKPEHVGQIARYFLLSGLELFVYVIEDKSTQHWHEVVADRTEPFWANAIEEQRWELNELNKAASKKRLPDRIPECAQLKGPTFMGCSFGGRTGVCARITEWPTNDTLREPSRPVKRVRKKGP